jgi:hypothetical protein
VIHGHTHAAKAYRCGKGLYLNAGTWAQLMRLPSSDATDAEWAAFLAALQPGGMDRTFARPTFVGVRRECENSEAAAEVCEWKAAGPETLAAWRFGEHRWSQEV